MVTSVIRAVRWIFVTSISMLDIRKKETNKKLAVLKSVNDLRIRVVMPLTPALLHLVLLKASFQNHKQVLPELLYFLLPHVTVSILTVTGIKWS